SRASGQSPTSARTDTVTANSTTNHVGPRCGITFLQSHTHRYTGRAAGRWRYLKLTTSSARANAASGA
ncbi:hypothetical protein PILCRDRAFT_821239, partial [Piloderma croceum F 1598]